MTLAPTLTRRAEIRRIIAEVAERHGLGPRDIIEPGRFGHIAIARHEAVRAVHDRFPVMTCTRLAAIFRRDHTTILFSLGRLRSKKPRSMGLR